MLSDILLPLLLILLNGFFAASEMAFVSLNENLIKMQAEEGDRKAARIDRLLSQPSKFLATIQIGITLAGYLASAFASDTFATPLVEMMVRVGVPIPEQTLKTIAMIIITLLLSYITLVFGELVPKRIAMKKPELISNIAAPILSMLSSAAAPFVKLLTLSTNFVVRLFGIDPNDNSQNVTEEEIRMMVDVGQEKGAIDEGEKQMINNIFEFNDKPVYEVMTHRSDIVALPITADLDEMLRMAGEEQYSRFPVYEDDIDNIVGVLHIKDLMGLMQSGSTTELRDIIRPPYFVPQHKRSDRLFNDMKKSKTHMVIVVDEYGGTAGLVTMEDLIEEIVGEIYDEHDEEELTLQKLDEDTYLVNGIMRIEEVNEQLDLSLPQDEYETLGGFVVGLLGRIPKDGETPVVEYGKLVLKVELVEDRRIKKIKMCGLNKEPQQSTQE